MPDLFIAVLLLYDLHFNTTGGCVAVVPVSKVHALTVSWAVPPQGKHYR